MNSQEWGFDADLIAVADFYDREADLIRNQALDLWGRQRFGNPDPNVSQAIIASVELAGFLRKDAGRARLEADRQARNARL